MLWVGVCARMDRHVHVFALDMLISNKQVPAAISWMAHVGMCETHEFTHVNLVILHMNACGHVLDLDM